MSRDESLIQQAIIEYLQLKNIFYFSVPNGAMLGGYNKFAVLNTLKKEGLRLGAPDLVIVLMNKVLFVEIKTLKGKLSDNQKEFADKVKNLGHDYLVWRSIDDCFLAIDKLTAQGV